LSLSPDVALRLQLHDEDRRANPLRYFRLMSWAQEKLVETCGRAEVYWHSSNLSGKTTAGCALDLAFLMGLPGLHAMDGRLIKIPVLRPPVTWALGVPSYKIAAGSSLLALRALLGAHPHVEQSQGGKDMVTSILIKHARSRSDEPDETWSKLFVFPYDGTEPEGVRLDGWHCDEPPPPRFLDALRTRKKAGHRLYGYITATPIDFQTWGPILKQYPDEMLKIEHGRMRMQSAVYDNKALTPEDIRQLEESLRDSPLRNARLLGEHVDASGACPFDAGALDDMVRSAQTPKRIDEITVEREVDVGGPGYGSRVLRQIRCRVEVWDDYEAGDSYLIVCDPGKGIKDSRHDPDCAHVWSRRRKKLVARFNEYVGGFGLGGLCARLGRRYGSAEVDPAVTGGYGEAVLAGLRHAGYGNIARNDKEAAPGVVAGLFGFTENREQRNAWRLAMEEAVAGRLVTIPSRDVLACLKTIVIDDKGKILEGPRHDEDWVCAGRAVWRLLRQPNSGAARRETMADMFARLKFAQHKRKGVQEVW